MAADRLNVLGDFQGQVSLVPEEHTDDRAARLQSEKRRALIHDCKEVVIFLVLLFAVIAVGIIAANESFWDKDAGPEARHWGQTILSAVMTGGISFVAGRKIGSKQP